MFYTVKCAVMKVLLIGGVAAVTPLTLWIVLAKWLSEHMSSVLSSPLNYITKASAVKVQTKPSPNPSLIKIKGVYSV